MIEPIDIHAYADRELAPEEMARLEQEISASPEAQLELQSILSLKQCLQTKTETPESAEAWKACRMRFDELDKAKKAEHFVGKYAWALCCTLFVVILVGGMLNRSRSGSMGMGEVASLTSQFVPSSTGVSSQPEQLRTFVQERTGATMDIRGLQLIAWQQSIQPVRGKVLQLLVRDQGGFVEILYISNVTDVDGVEPIGDDIYQGRINGLNCVTWQWQNRGQFFVIGARAPAQLKDFVTSRFH